MSEQALPRHLKIEVKSSRNSDYQLSQRDIDGIMPDGYGAILLTSRDLQGPRWVFVHARELAVGANQETALAVAARDVQAPASLNDSLNSSWSDWILDEDVQDVLFSQKSMPLRDAVSWCLESRRPRACRLTGAPRATRLARALERFRARIDDFLESGAGAQEEGQVHQSVLRDAVARLGYRVVNNPIGVPDIEAWLEVSVERLRSSLTNWDPGAEELRLVRDAILGLTDDDLRSLQQHIQ